MQESRQTELATAPEGSDLSQGPFRTLPEVQTFTPYKAVAWKVRPMDTTTLSQGSRQQVRELLHVRAYRSPLRPRDHLIRPRTSPGLSLPASAPSQGPRRQVRELHQARAYRPPLRPRDHVNKSENFSGPKPTGLLSVPGTPSTSPGTSFDPSLPASAPF